MALIFEGLLILTLGLILAMGHSDPSPATLNQMELIENSTDHRVEACNDFYSFACSNWEHLQSAVGSGLSNHDILKLNYFDQLKTMLNRQDMPKKSNQTFRDKAVAFYHSCKNDEEEFRFFDYVKPAENIEWPLISEFQKKEQLNFEKLDLFQFMGEMFSYGLNNFLINLKVKRQTNGNLYVTLDVPPQDVELSHRSMTSVLELSGFEEDNEMKENLFRNIRETHIKWLKIFEKFSNTQEDSIVLSFKHIKEEYPKLEKFLDSTFVFNQLDNYDEVEIKNFKYFNFLMEKQWIEGEVKLVEEEKLKNTINYAMALMMHHLWHEYESSCENMVRRKFQIAINYMYLQEYYTKEMQTKLKDLNEKIYKNLLSLINKNPLDFTEKQLQTIKDELTRIYVSVGNVPDYMDDSMIDEYYKHLPNMDKENMGKNFISLLRQKFWELFNCLENLECNQEMDFKIHYLKEKYLIIIPWAAMDPFMYDATFDPVLAVSLMGSILTQQYAHFIDAKALKDSYLYGDLVREFEKNSFIEKSIKCTKEQLNGNEYHLRTLQTDLLGVRGAFQTYQMDFESEQPSFTSIPWDQLFFLNYAQNFCQSKLEGKGPWEHETRLNYIAMNMKEFAEAFKCPVDSKMNSEKKCLFY